MKETKPRCGRCRRRVSRETAEQCWYCLAALCPGCWEERGHCGHPLADKTLWIGRLRRAQSAGKN